MSVYEIDEPTVDEQDALESCRALWAMRIECGWYSDKSGRVIGIVLHDAATSDWGYSVCRAGEHGDFRCMALQHGLQTEGKARTKILAEMRRLTLATDSTVVRRVSRN